jgi:oxygen-independent coproporphyrinogen-3 oxidase
MLEAGDMMLTVQTEAGTMQLDVERIRAALEPAGPAPYAPPHVFTIAAPRFVKELQAVRPRHESGPLGVYVHVPFCNYACNFCTYAKKVSDEKHEMTRYVDCLQRELEWIEPDTPLSQLLVGGGTPTALPPQLLDAVLAAVFARVNRRGEAIHTVECSPESLTAEHLDVLAAHGIGRISMGIQSLNDEVLRSVNRQHSASHALAVCDQLVASGRIVNVDLIYGLPGQTEEMFRRDMEALAARGVHSIHAYNLRVNEHTPVLQLLKTEERFELPQLLRWRAFVQRAALELGFEQTHWQVFSRPGLKFQNISYFGDQFGAGAGARTRLGATVYRNQHSVQVYMEAIAAGLSPVEDVFRHSLQDLKSRFIAQSLGIGLPLRRRDYEQEFGCSFDEDFGESLERLKDAELVADDGAAVALAPIGKLVYDRVTFAFYPRRLQEWLGERHENALARWTRERKRRGA